MPSIYSTPFGARAHTLYIFLVYHGHIPGRQAAPQRSSGVGLSISVFLSRVVAFCMLQHAIFKCFTNLLDLAQWPFTSSFWCHCGNHDATGFSCFASPRMLPHLGMQNTQGQRTCLVLCLSDSTHWVHHSFFTRLEDNYRSLEISGHPNLCHLPAGWPWRNHPVRAPWPRSVNCCLPGCFATNVG